MLGRELASSAEGEETGRVAGPLEGGIIDESSASAWPAESAEAAYGSLDRQVIVLGRANDDDGEYGDDIEHIDEDYDEDDEDDLFEDDDDEDDEVENEEMFLLRQQRRRTRARRRFCRRLTAPFRMCWGATRRCFVLVADVDNVWDSPDPEGGGSLASSGVGGAQYRQYGAGSEASPSGGGGEGGGGRRRDKLRVLFWFLVLAAAYASERSSFKLLVDRTGPFRLFSAEAITSAHAAVVGLGMLVGAVKRSEFYFKPLGLPWADVGLMAVLDTVHLLIGVVTGSHVPPVLTVILVQLTIPLTACITQCVHPDGNCRSLCCSSAETEGEDERGGSGSPNEESVGGRGGVRPSDGGGDTVPTGWGGLSLEHIVGSVIIFVAVLLGLCPAILSLIPWHVVIFEYEEAVPDRTAWNSLIFTVSCIPAAMSQLYKEHTLSHFKQPVDPDYLNFLLSVFQFFFAMIVSPLVYSLQGLGAGPGWASLYKSSEISTNFYDGLKCFVGALDETTAETKYPESASCNFAWGIVLIHVLSIVVVGSAVDKIVHAGATKVMYRGISAGIMLAVLAMFLYEVRDPEINYGPVINSMHWASTFILILGSEVYHRVSLLDATFETVYPEMESLYEDDE